MYKARMFQAVTLKAGTLKTGLSILLLTQSTILLAVPIAATADESAPGKLAPVNSALESTAESVAGSSGGAQQAADSQLGHFPRWPERQKPREELIPPPPPGPYMSTAMNNHTLRGSHFARGMNKPAHRTEPPAMSMDMFSPDRPWPDNLRPAKRWLPENGYRYVNPSANANSHSARTYNKLPRQNYGYRPAPMGSSGNWPTMNTPRPASGSGWMPSMGMSPGNSYSGNTYPASGNHQSGTYQSGVYRPRNQQRGNYQPRNHQPRDYQHRAYPKGAYSGGRQSTVPYPPQGRP